MSVSIDDARLDILNAVCQAAPQGGDAGEFDPFIHRYFRHVDDDELAARSPEQLAGLAAMHLALAHRRPVGAVNVRVTNPTVAEHGFAGPLTVIQIVTDDMPFLVDSISWEINRSTPIQLTIHPQLIVRRDAAGTLQSVVDLDEAPAGEFGVGRESWMCLVIDPVGDAEAVASMERRLRGVLSDVRDAVEDWPKMRAAAHRIARTLREGAPVAVDPAQAQGAADFLDWLADDNFTLLGYRQLERVRLDGKSVLRQVAGSGLGQWRYDDARVEPVPRGTARRAGDADVLTTAKSDIVSRVHRAAQQDVVTLWRYDRAGRIVGEDQFIGLYTSAAFNASVLDIPIVRDRVRWVITSSGYTTDSHTGRALVQVLEGFPRDELIQTDTARMAVIAPAILHLKNSGKPGVFLRPGSGGRFLSALVYIPRDRYTTPVRLRIAALLTAATGGEIVDYNTRVNEWSLARLHFSVRIAQGRKLPTIDVARLEQDIAAVIRSWEEDFSDAVRDSFPQERIAEILSLYARSFQEGYKEDVSGEEAAHDVAQLEAVRASGQGRYELYRPREADPDERRFKLYRISELSLTDILPMFTHLGVEMTDERTYEIVRSDGVQVYLYDVGLRLRDAAWDGPPAGPGAGKAGPRGGAAADPRTSDRFVAAVAAIAGGEVESDGFNALVLRAGLSHRQIVVLRAVAKYLRQGQATFSQEYVQDALVSNPHIARMLVELFEVRFDPERFGGLAGEDRAQAQQVVRDAIVAALDEVSSLDQDRIVRSMLQVIEATTRTSFYRRDADGQPLSYVSMKLEPRRIDFLPMPRPMFEIWVYSPRVEGVHMRFGTVARGGLRWSDRREDFRTEILGLVKAQTVKNVVIVPTGSKGGFFPKMLPDPAVDRDAWFAEGIAAYKIFIGGLLDLTDNLVGGAVVPPPSVVRHDGDDTYLVVAADKGTATFSDFANERSLAYGFWLDDAFASGGSAGYDHKGMGITARGAWESVKRHFREFGVDTQTQDFTVVGIGDMSGDVFGNGMLLSEHIRLVAAFDHRHVFVDPSPDAATSYAERQRLFALPRSSWADYDPKLISAGGGVFPRSAKSIPVTKQMAQALGIEAGVTAMTPAELIRAVLRAPVDLLWNGGIGTYVRATFETDAQIGDRSNDAIRVTGSQLRVKVVGEGGNLGCSQNGRIEAAQHGVRINTDAVDNSAGVDTSDHEVNLKILLTGVMDSGRLTRRQRDKLLASMTDEVGLMVLRHNYEQNLLLGNARRQAPILLPVHQRLIHQLERTADLDRALEFLPSDAELHRRLQDGQGLTSPELSVLLAYAKIWLKKELIDSALPDDPWLAGALEGYFPSKVRRRYRDEVHGHALRRQIVVNEVVNSLVNRGGITFMYRAMEETGATAERVARAFIICREVFDLAGFVERVEALDNQVPTDIQSQLYLEFRRLIDRATRWVITHRPEELDIAAEVARFAPGVRAYAARMPELLRGAELERLESQAHGYRRHGVPEDLARYAAGLLDVFQMLACVELARASEVDLDDVVTIDFLVSERLFIDAMLTRVTQLPREDHWDAMARGAMRDDLYAVLSELTASVLAASDPAKGAQARFEEWLAANREGLTRARAVLSGVDRLEKPGLAPLSVVLRTLRTVARPVLG